jgi:F-type H+-transporting ATPase subunit b
VKLGRERLQRALARTVLGGAVVIAAGLAASAASAAGGEGPSAMELVWQVVNFALLVTVLFIVARKPIASFFADRKEAIGNDIDEATRLLREAEVRYGEWQRKLVDLEAELETIRDGARRRAEEEHEHILADARATAERIRRDATAAVDREVRRGKDDLAAEAAELSLEMAAQVLKDQVTDTDRERLMDEFISSVEHPPTISGSGR